MRRASFSAPFPPCAQTSATSIGTSSCRHLSAISSISASVSVAKRLRATIGQMLNFFMFSTCFSRFSIPFRKASLFSSFKASIFTPPWYFKALTVATSTTALGFKPALTHLMSKNFSAPKSNPKPASVTTKSDKDKPILVAMMELVPCAIFAKGPPWIMAGFPSIVWTRFGFIASLSKAAIAPFALRSRAYIGCLS